MYRRKYTAGLNSKKSIPPLLVAYASNLFWSWLSIVHGQWHWPFPTYEWPDNLTTTWKLFITRVSRTFSHVQHI